jgi:hypothetical protein
MRIFAKAVCLPLLLGAAACQQYGYDFYGNRSSAYRTPVNNNYQSQNAPVSTAAPAVMTAPATPATPLPTGAPMTTGVPMTPGMPMTPGTQMASMPPPAPAAVPGSDANAVPYTFSKAGFYDAQGKYQGDNGVFGVVTSFLPPAGQCRIWSPDKPSSSQAPASPCLPTYSLRHNQYVIYGG